MVLKKKASRNTSSNTAVKRVTTFLTRKFHVVVVQQQLQRNLQKVYCKCRVFLLLVRRCCCFFCRPHLMPSAFSITRFYLVNVFVSKLHCISTVKRDLLLALSESIYYFILWPQYNTIISKLKLTEMKKQASVASK